MEKSPDGKRLYVAKTSSNTLAVVDTETNQLVREITTEVGPIDLALTQDGAKLAVVNEAARSLEVFDTASGTRLFNRTFREAELIRLPVGPIFFEFFQAASPEIPTAVELSPDGLTAYVGLRRTQRLVGPVSIWQKIDLASGQVIGELTLPDANPAPRGPMNDLLVTQGGQHLFIAHGGATGGIRILRADTLDEANAFPTDPGAAVLSQAPDGTRVFVGLEGKGNLHVIETVQGSPEFLSIVDFIELGDGVTGISITPDNQTLYDIMRISSEQPGTNHFATTDAERSYCLARIHRVECSSG